MPLSAGLGAAADSRRQPSLSTALTNRGARKSEACCGLALTVESRRGDRGARQWPVDRRSLQQVCCGVPRECPRVAGAQGSLGGDRAARAGLGGTECDREAQSEPEGDWHRSLAELERQSKPEGDCCVRQGDAGSAVECVGPCGMDQGSRNQL